MREQEAMSWSEQAETLMNALTEAQMTMWKSWCDLIQTAPTPPYPGFVDQWRALANQGLKGWTADSDQIVKDVAKRLLGAQNAMTRFLELSASAWKVMAPKAESGEDWETILKKYTGQLRERHRRCAGRRRAAARAARGARWVPRATRVAVSSPANPQSVITNL